MVHLPPARRSAGRKAVCILAKGRRGQDEKICRREAARARLVRYPARDVIGVGL